MHRYWCMHFPIWVMMGTCYVQICSIATTSIRVWCILEHSNGARISHLSSPNALHQWANKCKCIPFSVSRMYRSTAENWRWKRRRRRRSKKQKEKHNRFIENGIAWPNFQFPMPYLWTLKTVAAGNLGQICLLHLNGVIQFVVYVCCDSVNFFFSFFIIINIYLVCFHAKLIALCVICCCWRIPYTIINFECGVWYGDRTQMISSVGNADGISQRKRSTFTLFCVCWTNHSYFTDAFALYVYRIECIGGWTICSFSNWQMKSITFHSLWLNTCRWRFFLLLKNCDANLFAYFRTCNEIPSSYVITFRILRYGFASGRNERRSGKIMRENSSF